MERSWTSWSELGVAVLERLGYDTSPEGGQQLLEEETCYLMRNFTEASLVR